MKKEYTYLFIVIAFVAGIIVGVIAAVLYEEKNPMISSPVQTPSAATAPSVPPAEAQKQIGFLQSLLKEDPKNLKAFIELGNLYFDTEQFDRAVEVYSQALNLDPKNADVRTDRGIMFRRQGEFDKAIADFRQAAQDDPGHANSRYNLGIVLLHDKGDIKGAVAAWEDFLRVDPSGPRGENIRNQIGKLRGMIK